MICKLYEKYLFIFLYVYFKKSLFEKTAASVLYSCDIGKMHSTRGFCFIAMHFGRGHEGGGKHRGTCGAAGRVIKRRGKLSGRF